MEKQNKNKFLNKKHKRGNSNNKGNIKKNKFHPRQLEPIEELYQKAKKLYEDFSKDYDLDKIDLTLKANKDKKWTKDILTTGTFEDKISSLVLYIKNNPKYTLKYLEILTKMLEDKNRRKQSSIILALKDIYLENLLNGKKFIPFNLKYKSSTNNVNNDELIEAYFSDKIHNLYNRLINVLEKNVINEPLVKIKKKNLDMLLEMISKQPEGEEKILNALINKFGDPSTEVTNHVIDLLKRLQNEHMKMSLVIFNNVKTFYVSSQSQRAKLYALVYLTQMAIPHNFPLFLEESIKFFFELFNQFSSQEEPKKEQTKQTKHKKKKTPKKQEADNSEKILSLIVKRINILLKYVKNQKNKMEEINKIVTEKIAILFKLSHNKSLKLSIEILKLLFSIIETQDENFSDRYYKSLYDIIANMNISISKHLKDLLKLVLVSLINDSKINRICSFIKRLLQMSLESEPSYIICILIIISQVIRNKNKLWKLIDKDQQHSQHFYDSSKRDPQFSNGECSFINELTILTKHYHPSVQRMSKFIIDNYNKDVISYTGDPLIDFSLVNFLEKFILKNPKITKDKKKAKRVTSKEEEEDEELRKFMEEDDEDKNNKQTKGKAEVNEEIGEDDFKFISKFNKVFPEITSSKNYLKKMKKKEKKENNDEEDAIDGDEMDSDNDELEKYADKVIQKEYNKIGKDIDDDDDIEGLGEIEEDSEINENENEEEGDNEEDEEEQGEFFDEEGDLNEEDEDEEED